MEEAFPKFPASARRKMLGQIYSLATKRHKVEMLRISVVTEAASWRQRRLRSRRTRSFVENAKRSLRKAESLCGEAENMLYGFGPLIERLTSIADSLANSEDIFAASVHPALKSPSEREARFPSMDYSRFFSDFKTNALDYELIASIAACLKRCARSARVDISTGECDRIISQTFDAAFGEAYQASRVKTARRRIKRKHTVKSA
jgi:hypothetical protein